MKRKTARYMAGLFDAEGCFTINGSYRKASNCMGYTAQVILTNTNLKMMKWIVRHFGGVYKKRESHKGKSAYDWKLTNQKHGLSFISTIYPYLIVKRTQADVMLSYYSLNGAEQTELRQQLCDDIKRLKWNIGSVTTDMPNASNVSDAYCAGFVDGDGGVSGAPVLYVDNTDRRVVELFQQKYGGSLYTSRLNAKNSRWKDAHKWSIGNAEKVEIILLSWLPYLIDKRDRALAGLNTVRERKEAKIQSELMGDHESDMAGTPIS